MKIKRIFWKFFATFWLANLFIMMATTYVLLHHIETQRYREHHQRLLTELVDILETNPQRYRTGHRRLPRKFYKSALARTPIIEIFHQDELWYRYQPRAVKVPADFELKIESTSGNIYLAKTPAPRPPRFLAEWVQRKHKLELLIILLVSTVVSLLLSWSVTRPLKQLGASSRQFARGVRDAGIDPKLRARGDEFGELARDMAYLMDTVNATLSAQKQLLHDVSHELRAPLARLQVAAELIQQTDVTANPQIQRIHRECEHIDQLIQRILNFSRMEESAVASEFDLVALVQEQVDNALFEDAEREIHFTADSDHVPYFGYSELMSQSIENILRNACKYTPKNTPVEITLTRNTQHVQLRIRDHGPGVPEEELKRVAEPFYRGGGKMHDRSDSATPGFGLGLSIVMRTTQKHGGQLDIANHPQGGLVVTATLPYPFSKRQDPGKD